MKSKIWLSILVVISLYVGYALGYRAGYRCAFKQTVRFGVDRTDIQRRGPVTSAFEPYFTRGNPIPDRAR